MGWKKQESETAGQDSPQSSGEGGAHASQPLIAPSVSTASLGVESQGTENPSNNRRVTPFSLDSATFFCTPWDSEWYEADPNEMDSDLDAAEQGGEHKRKLIADLSLASQDTYVDPYTKDLVICNNSNLPVNLLETFPFIKDGKLVTGVTYDTETGEVVEGDVDGDLEGGDLVAVRRNSSGSCDETVYTGAKHAYARVITTNWWYTSLMSTFVIVSLIVMGKNANILFCICLLEEGHKSPMPYVARRLVALAVLFLEAFQIAIFYKIALKEFRSKSKESGDLVFSRRLNTADRQAPFWALVVFHVLEVDALIKDIVKYAHPFKDKQPFAALKADGHRAFLLGFRDVHSFYASHMPRPFSTLLSQALIEGILMEFKVLSAIKVRSPSFFVMALPGLFIMYLKLNECFRRLKHREAYWKHLHAAHHFGDHRDKQAANKGKQQLFPHAEWDQQDLQEAWGVKLLMAGLILLVVILAGALWYICL